MYIARIPSFNSFDGLLWIIFDNQAVLRLQTLIVCIGYYRSWLIYIFIDLDITFIIPLHSNLLVFFGFRLHRLLLLFSSFAYIAHCYRIIKLKIES